MNNKRIWLSPPHMGEDEINYVNEAFDTNWIAPLGPNVDAFEKQIIDYLASYHAVALTSGTAAIHLALILNNVAKDDIVICQSMTFSASANPIVYQGAVPVFIDSDSSTWNMDPDVLRSELHGFSRKDAKLIKKVKAIIPVHLYGMPAEMDEINGIAADYGIPVIEDAAEALGSEYKRRKCGGLTKLGILSFNGNKIITTSGGGALVSSDKNIIEKARFLATQARDPAPHYEHSHIGYNYRMSNILAGIGIGQMEVLDERVDKRRKNFNRYKNYFEKWNEKGFVIKFQPEPADSKSNRWLTCILIEPEKNNGLTAEKFRLKLEEANIESRPLWKPMHLQPVFRGCKYYGENISEKLFETGLCLPSGSNLTENDFDRIFGVIEKVMSASV